MERAATLWKPNAEISPTCPRCGSMNTKFCYYNNYSLTQPRYFCKGCRRYWTKGGSLRNVPVGGGCRKSRRGKSIRVSTDGTISGTASNKGLDRQVFIGQGISAENNSGASASPAAGTNGPNIDLAAVYANFMNQNPHPQPQPGHLPETLANNDGGAGPSFEFPGYPAMLNVDYFVPETAIAPHDGGFVVDEYGNNSAVLFQEQFCSNNNDDDHHMMTSCGGVSLPPILPSEELTTSGGIGIGWSNDNSEMNMMFPLQTSTHHEPAVMIEPEVQGCPNHHTNSSASLFSIPSYESIFRP